MKLLSLIFISILFWSCISSKKNIYNEANYKLFKIDSVHDTINRKLFVYKYDTARKMEINYYYSGEILNKGFTYKGRLDGVLRMYNMAGKIVAINTYRNGVVISSKWFGD